MPAKKPHTVADFIRYAERRFKQAKLAFGHGTDNARDEAAWLVASGLGIAFEELEEKLDTALTEQDRAAVQELVEARISTRKPAAYLLKEAWFAGLRFYVDERVIVPRSHIAEFILEEFQPWIDPQAVHHALDLCTGSGCIAVALAYAFPGASVDAADLSPQALEVAAINVERHAMQERVRLVRSDLFAALGGRRYDLVVSNPPYVDADDMRALPPEYRHEPALALAAGQNGLDVVIRILAEAADYLTPAGVLVAEVGNSNVALQERFPDVPFVWLSTSTGDESVFLLTAAQLEQYRAVFAAAR